LGRKKVSDGPFGAVGFFFEGRMIRPASSSL